jgi:glycogen debranching enzyme
LIASGFAEYGLNAEAGRVFTGLVDAGMYFDFHRMLELFCGFGSTRGEGPIVYPVACAPQAWAAASIFQVFQACLELTVNGIKREVSCSRPFLPDFIPELRIHNLDVADATVDLLLVRHGGDVGANVLRYEGKIRVTVAK